MDEVLVKEEENSSEEEIIKTKEIIMDLDAYQREQEELEKKNKVSIRTLGYLFTKRVFDIVCGLIGVICMIPLMFIVKLITVCSGDFHSIFYFQKRIGKDGKEFRLYKFRSMVPNADEILEQTLKMDKVRAEEWNKYTSNNPYRKHPFCPFRFPKYSHKNPQAIQIAITNIITYFPPFFLYSISTSYLFNITLIYI